MNIHTELELLLACAKAEIEDVTVCIVVNGEKFQSHAVTVTLIGQSPMSNSSEIFSYAAVYSNLWFLDELFFELSCLQTHRQTDRHTHRHTPMSTL